MKRSYAIVLNALLSRDADAGKYPVTIAPEIKTKIDAYFDHKRAHNGFFKDDAERDAFVDPIIDACNAAGLSCSVVAGHIWIEGDDTVYSFSTEFPNGYLDVSATNLLRGTNVTPKS